MPSRLARTVRSARVLAPALARTAAAVARDTADRVRPGARPAAAPEVDLPEPEGPAAYARRVSAQRLVAAPRDAVADLLTDLDRSHEWLTLHLSWRGERPERMTPGATFTQQIRLMDIPAQARWEVERADEDGFALRGTGPMGITVGLWATLQDAPGGTAVRLDGALDGGPVRGPVGLTAVRSVETALGTSLAELADLLEGGTAAARLRVPDEPVRHERTGALLDPRTAGAGRRGPGRRAHPRPRRPARAGRAGRPGPAGRRRGRRRRGRPAGRRRPGRGRAERVVDLPRPGRPGRLARRCGRRGDPPDLAVRRGRRAARAQRGGPGGRGRPGPRGAGQRRRGRGDGGRAAARGPLAAVDPPGRRRRPGPHRRLGPAGQQRGRDRGGAGRTDLRLRAPRVRPARGRRHRRDRAPRGHRRPVGAPQRGGRRQPLRVGPDGPQRRRGRHARAGEPLGQRALHQADVRQPHRRPGRRRGPDQRRRGPGGGCAPGPLGLPPRRRVGHRRVVPLRARRPGLLPGHRAPPARRRSTTPGWASTTSARSTSTPASRPRCSSAPRPSACPGPTPPARSA